MDGALLVDKPSGPTSHDVVQRLRRALGESRIGHTGTLDPRATGLLPIVIGRATRLASRLSAHRKTYEADICLGVATTTDDADGEALGERRTVPNDPAVVRAALGRFLGTIEQVPPRHSAKKIAGERAYDLARRDLDVVLKPVAVTVFGLEEMAPNDAGDGHVRVRVTASSGFYVRSLARDLGDALGCGGHLFALRRTSVGAFDVRDAMSLDEAERLGRGVEGRLLAMAALLPDAPAVHLSEHGLHRVRHGNPVGLEGVASGGLPPPGTGDVRLLDGAGALVAVAQSRGGALHPIIVVG